MRPAASMPLFVAASVSGALPQWQATAVLSLLQCCRCCSAIAAAVLSLPVLSLRGGVAPAAQLWDATLPTSAPARRPARVNARAARVCGRVRHHHARKVDAGVVHARVYHVVRVCRPNIPADAVRVGLLGGRPVTILHRKPPRAGRPARDEEVKDQRRRGRRRVAFQTKACRDDLPLELPAQAEGGEARMVRRRRRRGRVRLFTRHQRCVEAARHAAVVWQAWDMSRRGLSATRLGGVSHSGRRRHSWLSSSRLRVRRGSLARKASLWRDASRAKRYAWLCRKRPLTFPSSGAPSRPMRSDW